MPRLRRSASVRRRDEVRTFVGYALIGVVNSILPFLVHSANHLIVPYSRPVVLILELLPAALVKFLFPQLLRAVRMPYAIRPLVFSACWVLTWIVAWATPPNVPPPFRILMTLLAAATSAGTEVSALGQLRYYGLTGLAGWGFGTGLGGLVVSGLPLYLTVVRGKEIRDSVPTIWKLAIVILVTFLVVLPGRSAYTRDVEDLDFDLAPEEGSQTSLLQTPVTKKDAMALRVKLNVSYARSLIKPYMLPLLAAFSVQAVVLGMPRTLDTYLLGDFQHYRTAYGMTLHAGSLLARTSVLFIRVRRARFLQTLLYLALGLMVLNGYFLFTTIAPFVMVLFVGILAGTVYSNTLANVMDDITDLDNQEFSLSSVGAGETAGLLVGGLFGAFFESTVCGFENDGTRWCHFPRPRSDS